MTVEQYNHVMKWGRDLSIRHRRIVVMTIPPNGVWEFYTFKTPAEARGFFAEMNNHPESWKEPAYFIVRNGIVMAQRQRPTP